MRCVALSFLLTNLLQTTTSDLDFATALNTQCTLGEFRPVLLRLEEHMRRHNDNMIRLGGKESNYLPFVTLTYAQTIDGSIAAINGSEQLILSSPESMNMTHHLRSMHDAILIGVKTLQSDNPSLTVRLCSGKNPQPIVLDSKLSINVSCRCENKAASKRLANNQRIFC